MIQFFFISIIYIYIYKSMFANLSAAILYYYCVSNNISIPIIIPFLIGLRSVIILQADDSIFKKLEYLQEKNNSDIEYYSSIIISIVFILYLYFNNPEYQYYLSIFFMIIIILYLLLLLMNYIYLKNNNLLK